MENNTPITSLAYYDVSVDLEFTNTILLTLDLRTGTNCCRFIRRPIESAAVLTSGPSANVSNMASRASLITHKLF